MAFPIYLSTGGIGTGTDFSVAVPYPSVVNENDILIASIMDADNDKFDHPLGWTKFASNYSHSNLSVAFYWKRADGTETGTETFTSLLNAGSLVAGIMYRFSGCVKYGNPVEAVVISAVSQDTVYEAVTGQGNPGGFERLNVTALIVEDNTIDTYVGAGTADPKTTSQEESRIGTTVGSDAHFALQSHKTVGNVSPPYHGYWSGGNEFWSHCVFYLIPESDITVTLNTADTHEFSDGFPTLEFTGNSLGSFIDWAIVSSVGGWVIDLIDEYTGQSFTGKGVKAKGCSFEVDKLGTVTGGTYEARLYAHTGTYGTSSDITGSALAVSGTLNVSDLPIDPEWINFTFITPYQLIDGTKYCIVLYMVSSITGGGSIRIWTDSSNIGDGNAVSHTGGSGANNTKFIVYGNKDLEYEVEFDTVNTFDSIPITWASEGQSGDGSQDSCMTDELDYFEFSLIPNSNGVVNEITLDLLVVGTPVGHLEIRVDGHIENFAVGGLTTGVNILSFSKDFRVTKGTNHIFRIWNPNGGNDFSNRVCLEEGTTFSTGTYKWSEGSRGAAVRYIVKGSKILLSALSSVPDAGFLNVPTPADLHPFNDNEKIGYTVQVADELAEDTYYWRVKAIDPLVINAWGDWATIRLFTVVLGGGTPQDKMKLNIGDVWKTPTTGQVINVGGVWKTIVGMQINVGGVWKTVF